MRFPGLAFAAAVFVSLGTGRAEITFRCNASPGSSCQFRLVKDGNQGHVIKDLRLSSGKTGKVPDHNAGMRYCVVASPNPVIKAYPPNCLNAEDGKPGKVVDNLQAGGTYNYP